jgi:hypothetical protein
MQSIGYIDKSSKYDTFVNQRKKLIHHWLVYSSPIFWFKKGNLSRGELVQEKRDWLL